MTGYVLICPNAASTSGIAKQSTSQQTMVKAMLTKKMPIMDRGTVFAALRTSSAKLEACEWCQKKRQALSDMILTASVPHIMYIALSCPASTANPMDDHPPVFSNPVRTSAALAFGAFTHIGTRTAKNASICSTKKAVWTRGMYRVSKMLAATVKAMLDMTKRLPCQAGKA